MYISYTRILVDDQGASKVYSNPKGQSTYFNAFWRTYEQFKTHWAHHNALCIEIGPKTLNVQNALLKYNVLTCFHFVAMFWERTQLKNNHVYAYDMFIFEYGTPEKRISLMLF